MRDPIVMPHPTTPSLGGPHTHHPLPYPPDTDNHPTPAPPIDLYDPPSLTYPKHTHLPTHLHACHSPPSPACPT